MIAKWVAVLLLASPAGLAAAQQQPASQTQSQNAERSGDQQDPLAAAARRAQEEKKQQPRAAKVWDNDNIPKSPGTVSVVGESGSAAPSGQETTTTASGGAEVSKETEKKSSLEEQKAALEKQLEQAKAHLKSVTTDLDIATRTNQLDQQSFYSNPNYASDTEGAAKLKNEQSDVDAKKQEVDDLRKNVDTLTAKLAELENGSSKPAPAPQ